MGSLQTALIFVLFVNVFLWLSQVAVMELNPDSSGFYNPEGSLIAGFDSTGDLENPSLDKEGIPANLPTGEGSVSPETGNFFTDLFASIKSWFISTPGISYIYGVVMAPYNMLSAMGVPEAFRFIIGGFWYGLTIFLIVAFFWGRE